MYSSFSFLFSSIKVSPPLQIYLVVIWVCFPYLIVRKYKNSASNDYIILSDWAICWYPTCIRVTKLKLITPAA